MLAVLESYLFCDCCDICDVWKAVRSPNSKVVSFLFQFLLRRLHCLAYRVAVSDGHKVQWSRQRVLVAGRSLVNIATAIITTDSGWTPWSKQITLHNVHNVPGALFSTQSPTNRQQCSILLNNRLTSSKAEQHSRALMLFLAELISLKEEKGHR